VLTDKQHGGSVFLYVNKRWCSTAIQEELCKKDIELLAVSLHPFYLPREFLQLFLILVHIHPRANPKAAFSAMDKFLMHADPLPSPSRLC